MPKEISRTRILLPFRLATAPHIEGVYTELTRVVVKDHSQMDNEVLLAWRSASCIWSSLLGYIQSRYPGLKGSHLDPWCHDLGIPELF